MAEELELLSPEMQMLLNNRQDGFNYRLRRHPDWDENYEFYRDRVQVNRLIQRQSVNVPIMKQTIRSLLKDVDDMPVLYFENLDNDKQAELFKNEYWKYTVEENRMELQDIVDKRQVFLFGRSFDQMQIIDGKVVWTIQDPMDILVSRFTDPFNIHSSRFLIHTGIFRPLSTLSQNKDYNPEVVADLNRFYATQMGLIKAAENRQNMSEKNIKLNDMGVPDLESPLLGETYIELSLHFVYRSDEKDEKGNLLDEQLFLYVVADNMRILMKKPLEEVIGTTSDHYFRTHYPYNSWGDDLERQDFWSDGVADIVRTSNKIMNAWFSQLVENRTLRSLNMYFYNNNIEGFNPQTYEPRGFGMYGIPVPQNGRIEDVIKTVEIPDLKDSLEEMTWITQMLEKATGATATQQGQQTERQVTFGEVQLALGEAKERIKGMSKFYTPAWKERGTLFIKLLEAAGDKLDAVTLYKKGINSSAVYSREVAHTDWQSKIGYRCKVWSMDEKQAMDTDSINILNAVSQQMPDNPKVTEVKKRKLLEFAKLTPDEINEAMQYEEKKQQALAYGEGQGEAPAKESIAINYKDAPADIQRQMEKAAGFQPSQLNAPQVDPMTGQAVPPEQAQLGSGQPTLQIPAGAEPKPIAHAVN